jgi:tRNA(Arg) A34 adenosine deaminase TadA
LETSTMYSSTEPCPMCAGAIHWTRIGRVVYALSQERLYQFTSEASEDKPLRLSCREVFSKCERKIEVEGPALEEEAAVVHNGFWK